ncbi:thiamine-monophosphate kinase [Polymorphobacter glacialis]|uniref:Thiamine-monophosphate kinase n=1 Tax=Sandarakinorhabdus glacialis TaxID=1614636 RepID=A0A916ZYK8_9SPHN|nr:thiamine-phosphate kinase [Polymorphobacter glacialis]GGE18664.1 thiamine-monophosphate kinase [Polymorphobacter glacialis]
MGGEREFIASLLVPLANTPAARGLADDAAVWTPPLGRDLVVTHDVLACGVHYLPGDPPGDVAWKLLAVNLSDLAAMGATPAGVLMGLALSAAEDGAWREAFVAGLGRAMTHFGVAMWGGDTVTGIDRAVLGLTAVGFVEPGQALARSGASVGDDLWVSGTIGDAGLGLAIALGEAPGDSYLLNRFRRPLPRLALGQALAGIATACMDVSDGLLIDADRIGRASGVRLSIVLADVPLSGQALARTDGDAGMLARATAGDDYELLFTAHPDRRVDVAAAATASRTPVTRIGQIFEGVGVAAVNNAGVDITPARLGWEHS